MKGAPKGNDYAKGNKGGGRKSAYEEATSAIWHAERWELDNFREELRKKVESGVHSVRDVFLLKALDGNERILGIFANKLLPDLVDHTSKGEKMAPTNITITPELARIKERFEDELRDSLSSL